MRTRVLNLDYAYDETGRLVRVDAHPKPWATHTGGRTKRHKTHAKAIKHACKKAKKKGKKL